MLWTGSVISEDAGDDLTTNQIGADSSHDANHGEAAIQFFVLFVEAHVSKFWKDCRQSVPEAQKMRCWLQ